MTSEESERNREANRRWRKNHPERSKQLNRENAARLRAKYPDRITANNRKSKYGVTKEWYDSKKAEQEGKCAICGKPETGSYRGKIKALAIDHSHLCCSGKKSCGKCVRGLLCENCNRLLGMALENIKTLESAIEYLRRYNGCR